MGHTTLRLRACAEWQCCLSREQNGRGSFANMYTFFRESWVGGSVDVLSTAHITWFQ